MTISGRSRVVAVVADPIVQVRSIGLLNAHPDLVAADLVAIPAHVAPDGLAAFVTATRAWRNLAGLMVSIPHKVAAAGLVDELGGRAAASGTVNVIRRSPDGRLSGECTDGLGFVRNLAAHGVPIDGGRVLIVGTGGAARAIAAELAVHGAETVDMAGRSADRARAAAAAVRHASVRAETTAPERYDIVVNATPLGLSAADPLPFEPGATAGSAVICDIVMPAGESPLIAAARALGRRVVAGDGMLRQQLDANAAYVLGT